MERFRTLRADEIEVRIGKVCREGLVMLLYKDARCDMNILDETVGPLNWERVHTRENANCIVRIWDSEKKMWVSKEDTGKESFTEKEKGLASDSFKRACFNWGIGRELYTAPFIWVQAAQCRIEEERAGGKSRLSCRDRFSVRQIGYDEKRCISSLEIWNSTQKKTAFRFGMVGETEEKQEHLISKAMQESLAGELKRAGKSLSGMLDWLKVESMAEITEEQFRDVMERLSRVQGRAEITEETRAPLQ